MRTSKKSPAKKERRKVKLPTNSRLNKRIVKELDNLIEFVPVNRLSRNLRDLLLLYLAKDEDGLPTEFNEFPTDFYFLLQFLDIIEEEMALQGVNNR